MWDVNWGEKEVWGLSPGACQLLEIGRRKSLNMKDWEERETQDDGETEAKWGKGWKKSGAGFKSFKLICTTVMKGAIIRGSWVKGTQELSELFLQPLCESKCIWK